MDPEETRRLDMPGIWWIPGKQDDSKLGVLTWLPNRGCRLTLVDSSDDLGWDLEAGLIQGINSDHAGVTLVGCRQNRFPGWHWHGNVTSRSHLVGVRMALIGYMFASVSEIAIEDVYASYAGLDSYIVERYYDLKEEEGPEGHGQDLQFIFELPEYREAATNAARIQLHAGWTLDSGLEFNHSVKFSFADSGVYNDSTANQSLVHVVFPAFLSVLMGQESFITSLDSSERGKPFAIYDETQQRRKWNNESDTRDRLVIGSKESLDHWPRLVPSWVKNFELVSNLSKAYVRIISEIEDGFFQTNSLVHIFFGIEHYHKAKCSLGSSSFENAVQFAIDSATSWFDSVDEFKRVLNEIDVNSLVRARQVLVHANEGEPDYPHVYNQLIFITRCVLLMEMEYPHDDIEQETQRWDLWNYFAGRRKKAQEEASD